jgi:hypothetical protein
LNFSKVLRGFAVFRDKLASTLFWNGGKSGKARKTEKPPNLTATLGRSYVETEHFDSKRAIGGQQLTDIGTPL